MTNLWPLKSSRRLHRRYGIFFYYLQHQQEQFDTFLFCYPCKRAFEKFVDPWPILQGCKWQFEKKKQEHGQIPSKQAENEYNCKIREKKTTGNPVQKQENLQHWFWPRSRERNIWQICSCGNFCSLWSQEQFDMLHDIIWTFWYFYTHRGCHLKKSPLWRKW